MMNEQKLNEIVEQAIAQNESDWPHFRGALTGSGSLYLHVFAEKFAELIVREAIEKIESIGFKSSNDIPFETTELFVSQIKQHFGVEA